MSQIERLEERVAELERIVSELAEKPRRPYVKKSLAIVREPVAHPARLSEVVTVVCELFYVTPEELSGPSRVADVALARMSLFYLCVETTNRSIYSIGHHLRRDNTTVHSGARRVTKKIEAGDHDLRDLIKRARMKISARVAERENRATRNFHTQAERGTAP